MNTPTQMAALFQQMRIAADCHEHAEWMAGSDSEVLRETAPKLREASFYALRQVIEALATVDLDALKATGNQ